MDISLIEKAGITLRTFKIIQLLCITGVLAGCGPSLDTRIVARVVDYKCEPIPGYDVILTQGLGPRVPYGGGSTWINKETSDEEGYVTFDMSNELTSVQFRAYDEQQRTGAYGWPILMDISRRSYSFRYLDDKPITYDDVPYLEASTRENPLYIYVPDEQAVGRYSDDTHEFYMQLFGVKKERKFVGLRRSNKSPVVMHTYLENGNAVLEVIGVGDGGVQELPADVPRSDYFPENDYINTLRYQLQPGRFTRAFYVLGDDRRWTSLLFIDLEYDETRKLAYINRFVQTYENTRHDKSTDYANELYHPVELCGGAFSRGPDGYHALLNEEKKRWIDAGYKPEIRAVVNAERAMEKKASDPETGSEWIDIKIRSLVESDKEKNAIRVAIAALDNNADLPERITMLYNLAREYGWTAVIKRIASDQRTPMRILRDILKQDSFKYVMEIWRNNHIDDALINQLLDQMPEYKVSFTQLSQSVVKMKNASAVTHARVFQLFNDSGFPWGVIELLEWPDVDMQIMIAIMDHAINEQVSNSFYRDKLGDALGKNLVFRKAWLKQLQSPGVVESMNSAQHKFVADVWQRVKWNYHLTDSEIEQIEQLFSAMGYERKWFWLEDYQKRDRQKSLRNITGNVDTEDYDQLVKQDWNDGQLELLASNRITPSTVLAVVFEKMQDSRVVEYLAGHPNTPSEVLIDIDRDEYFVANSMPRRIDIDRALYCNPAFYPQLRARLPYLLDSDCEQYVHKNYR